MAISATLGPQNRKCVLKWCEKAVEPKDFKQTAFPHRVQDRATIRGDYAYFLEYTIYK